MDKKSKIVLIICIIIIVVGIGVVSSVAIIKNHREKIDINQDKTTEIEKKDVEDVLEYNKDKDVNELTDDELDSML